MLACSDTDRVFHLIHENFTITDVTGIDPDSYTHLQNYSSLDNVDQAVEYLKDPTHFRSFGQGLTELLQRCV